MDMFEIYIESVKNKNESEKIVRYLRKNIEKKWDNVFWIGERSGDRIPDFLTYKIDGNYIIDGYTIFITDKQKTKIDYKKKILYLQDSNLYFHLVTLNNLRSGNLSRVKFKEVPSYILEMPSEKAVRFTDSRVIPQALLVKKFIDDGITERFNTLSQKIKDELEKTNQ
jgi:hypothetical protein